jgi:prepilin-type N-terminal cleavage/methylation domain-containing protein
MNPHRQTAGFSLVEVLCAILILGIGVAGMTQGVASALRSSKESELQTQAVLLAASRLEMLRAEGWYVEGEMEGTGPGALADFRWHESIQAADLEGLYEVSVTVRHGERETPLYELKTLLFDPPVVAESETEQDQRERDRSSTRRAE